MQTFIEIKERFKSTVNGDNSRLNDTYVKFLTDIYVDFATRVGAWRNVVKYRNRILSYNLIYGNDANLTTEIPVEFKNVFLPRNLISENLLKDKNGTSNVSFENFAISFNNIIGPSRMVSLDLINKNKMNIINNISAIINRVDAMYHRFHKFSVEDILDYDKLLDKLWLFYTMVSSATIVLRTATDVMYNYLEAHTPDYVSMKKDIQGITFNEIPTDVSTLREEEDKR